MFDFQPAPEPESGVEAYGFGTMLLDSRGNIAIGHIGGTAGYQSFMLYMPATDRYVSGCINVLGDLGAVLAPVMARAAAP
jgi:D-alanyl-D-alanine carboxypeptidase